MLRRETDRNYIVYPSWAELPAKWADLPRLLARPLESGFIKPDFDYRRFGYPDEIQPFELFDGPVGNGIIVWTGDPTRGRWLPLVVLHHEANLRHPNGMDLIYNGYRPGEPTVAYLEPMGAPGWELGVARKPLNLRPGVSFEHADSAGDRAYWIVRHKGPARSSEEPAPLGRVIEWAEGFGLQARRLESPPDALLAETAPWFRGPSRKAVWFEVGGDLEFVGYPFAVTVYLANHLRWVVGPKMDSMHLVARIEGRPNACRSWNPRS